MPETDREQGTDGKRVAVKQLDEKCRGEIERYLRRKELELEERALALKQFCERYGFDE